MKLLRGVGGVVALGLAACQGPAGPVGPAGPPGAAAGGGATVYSGSAGYQPKFWFACDVALNLMGTDTLETGLGYSVTLFSNHDAQVNCYAELGIQQSGSASNYYPSITNGAMGGTCIASYDLHPDDNNVSGAWDFEVTDVAVVSTYHDRGDVSDGMVYTFVDADCTAARMDSTGTWIETTVSALLKQ
jgi:hypothetical protein